jgi:hypothetical protein
VKIVLNAWEFKAAVDTAIARMTASIDAGITDISRQRRDYQERLKIDVQGACGEIAVAKAIGKYWAPSVNTFHTEPDIAPDIEVRHTDRVDGSLIVRPNDDPDRWYFLVTGTAPEFQIVGYIKGSAARQPAWESDPGVHRPAWFVPQTALTPLQADREATA